MTESVILVMNVLKLIHVILFMMAVIIYSSCTIILFDVFFNREICQRLRMSSDLCG